MADVWSAVALSGHLAEWFFPPTIVTTATEEGTAMYPLTEGETEAQVSHTQARSTARTRSCWAPSAPGPGVNTRRHPRPLYAECPCGGGALRPSMPECRIQGCCELEWGKRRLYSSSFKVNITMSSKYECRRQATLAFAAPGTFFSVAVTGAQCA